MAASSSSAAWSTLCAAPSRCRPASSNATPVCRRKGRLDLAVTDLGPKELKNIAEPIRVYSFDVGQPGEAKLALTAAPEKSAPPRLSMVVLPFANIGGDPEQEHFVDGVTESLTTDLSRRRRAFVIARNTTFTYKGQAAFQNRIRDPISPTSRRTFVQSRRLAKAGFSFRSPARRREVSDG